MYDSNRQTGHETALEASPIATAVCKLMETRDLWEGTASDLLKELESLTDDRTIKSRNWANNSRSLGRTLVRIAPDLRGVGIEFTKPPHKNRLIRLEKMEKQMSQMSLTLEPISADSSSSLVNSDVSLSSDVSISYKAANTQKTLSAETKTDYQLQPTSDISDISDVSQPKLSNSSHSISSPITVGSMVNKQHKRGWAGMVKAIDGNTAKVLWIGDKFPSSIPLQELKLANQQEVADKTRS